jgi:O-antigen/teichoic acid export membrane protein
VERIGRILGDKALGFYQISSRVANLPATHITQMTSPLAFPMYARLQDKPAHLQKAYLELLQILLFVLLPVSAFLFLYAPEIIDIFWGAAGCPLRHFKIW